MRFIVVLLALLPEVVAAQGRERSAEAYAFVAPGFRPSDGTATASDGGGGDWFATDWLMLGADAHFFGRWRCPSCGAFVFTGNVGFVKRARRDFEKWQPFVKLGFGGAGVEGGAIGVAALSVGTSYWRSERLGLRFECRYEYVLEKTGFLHFRVGVVF